MDRLNRVYRLHQLLVGRRVPVPRATLERELECSRATLTRMIGELRDQLGAPVEFDRERGGYHYTDAAFELPGLWFTPSELYALLAARKLLDEAHPGLLDAQLAPLRGRIEKLLAGAHFGQGDLHRRVRILRQAAREPDAGHFRVLAEATARRRRVDLRYAGRERGEESTREISPQRLIHYRDNWYLDAWCHAHAGIRSFALERVRAARLLDSVALDLDEAELDGHFRASYGIFSGAAEHHAVLRFSPERARWVADERWHADQRGRWLADGAYELEIPYGDPRELILDILRHGPDVEVIAPASLRDQVRECLARALERYREAD